MNTAQINTTRTHKHAHTRAHACAHTWLFRRPLRPSPLSGFWARASIPALKPAVDLGVTLTMGWGIIMPFPGNVCSSSHDFFGWGLQGNKTGSVQTHPGSALVLSLTKADKGCQYLCEPGINGRWICWKGKHLGKQLWVNYKWFLDYQSSFLGCGPLRRSWGITMNYERAGWGEHSLDSESGRLSGVMTFDRTEICVFTVPFLPAISTI